MKHVARLFVSKISKSSFFVFTAVASQGVLAESDSTMQACESAVHASRNLQTQLQNNDSCTSEGLAMDLHAQTSTFCGELQQIKRNHADAIELARNQKINEIDKDADENLDSLIGSSSAARDAFMHAATQAQQLNQNAFTIPTGESEIDCQTIAQSGSQSYSQAINQTLSEINNEITKQNQVIADLQSKKSQVKDSYAGTEPPPSSGSGGGSAYPQQASYPPPSENSPGQNGQQGQPGQQQQPQQQPSGQGDKPQQQAQTPPSSPPESPKAETPEKGESESLKALAEAAKEAQERADKLREEALAKKDDKEPFDPNAADNAVANAGDSGIKMKPSDEKLRSVGVSPNTNRPSSRGVATPSGERPAPNGGLALASLSSNASGPSRALASQAKKEQDEKINMEMDIKELEYITEAIPIAPVRYRTKK